MPFPPLFPEARQRAFQPLAKSRRRFALTAAGGEDRLEGSAVTIGQAAHLSLQRGARASVHFSSGTDTPSSPRSTTRSGNSPPPPTLPIPRALPGRAPEASTSSCASSCLLCGL